MNNEDKLSKIKEHLKHQDLFNVLSIDNVNYKPHPFCIGSEHIQQYSLDTSKGCAMRVASNGKWSTNYKQGYNRCGLSIEEHTCDTVAFLQLLRNGTNNEAQIILKELVDKLGENFVTGFSFVETEEKYRIQ